MKVIGINTSARADGNTAILLHTVFEELNLAGIETEMIQLAGKSVEPCKACWACGGKGNCVHGNDSFCNIAYGQRPGDVAKDEEGMTTMKNLGKNMAYLLNALNADISQALLLRNSEFNTPNENKIV